MSERLELLPFVRKKVGDFLYPYGSFPDEQYEQPEGYEIEYHTPDADAEAGQHYRVEILVSAEKLVPLWLDLCTLLPERVRVSLDRTSADLYNRWDEFGAGLSRHAAPGAAVTSRLPGAPRRRAAPSRC